MATAKKPNAFEKDDMTLWGTYKKGGADANSAKWQLLGRFKGMISSQASVLSNVLPKPVVEAKLKRYAIMGFDTYKPGHGTKLSTHVMNYMQKIHRDNYNNQQAVRLPENVAIGFGRYTGAVDNFTELHEREPTTHELATQLGWSVKETENAQKKYHKEYSEGKQTFDKGVHTNDVSESVLRFVYHTLSDNERFVLEHRTGYLGKPIYDAVRIQRALNVSPYQFYTMQNDVRKKVAEAMGILNAE